MNKNHRLHKSEQILATIKNNKIIHSPTINMFYRKNNLPTWQVAIVVSKKKFNTAVQRNKIRRQVKAIIRELNLQIGYYQIVFLVKVEWLEKTYWENKEILKNLLNKLPKGVDSNG